MSRKAATVSGVVKNLRQSRLTGPLHVQVGDEHLTIHPGGIVEVTPALAAALGEHLLSCLEPVKPGPTESPTAGPTEEA